jgi:hypothetical protein
MLPPVMCQCPQRDLEQHILYQYPAYPSEIKTGCLTAAPYHHAGQQLRQLLRRGDCPKEEVNTELIETSHE